LINIINLLTHWVLRLGDGYHSRIPNIIRISVATTQPKIISLGNFHTIVFIFPPILQKDLRHPITDLGGSPRFWWGFWLVVRVPSTVSYCSSTYSRGFIEELGIFRRRGWENWGSVRRDPKSNSQELLPMHENWDT